MMAGASAKQMALADVAGCSLISTAVPGACHPFLETCHSSCAIHLRFAGVEWREQLTIREARDAVQAHIDEQMVHPPSEKHAISKL